MLFSARVLSGSVAGSQYPPILEISKGRLWARTCRASEIPQWRFMAVQRQINWMISDIVCKLMSALIQVKKGVTGSNSFV